MFNYISDCDIVPRQVHTNSKLLFSKYARPHFRSGIKVLEIGPDGEPSTYRSLVNDASITWDTLDITWDTLDMRSSPSLKYCTSSEYEFPVPTGAYDLILSGQVIEHVRKVWVWMQELARVCKKGGLVITINPVSWPFHEAPVDCWRMYPEAMRSLYEWANLRVTLCQCESLEADGYRRYIPGRSAEWQSRKERLMYKILGHFGLPVERSYDTITIGEKI